MFKLEFILPLMYGGYVSIMILKYGLINININTLTFGIYLLNIIVVYVLHRFGKVFDKCLEQLF